MVAVPSSSFRQVVRELAGHVSPQTLVISLTKGIEAGGFRLMSEILREEMPDNPRGVLSGPNLAREIAAGQITGIGNRQRLTQASIPAFTTCCTANPS